MRQKYKNIILTTALYSGLAFAGLAVNAPSAMSAMTTYSDAASVVKHGTCGACSNVSLAASVQAANPSEQLIKNIGDQAIDFLSNASLSDTDRRAEFHNLLVENFDLKTIGRFALGRYWRLANDEQKSEYFDLFEKMVVSVYSERFEEYSGQKLQILDSRPDGSKDMIVHSIVKSSGGNGGDVRVDWRVREKKDGSHKVVDVIVEGVSMSVTQRSDFSSVIQRGGGNIEVLLNHLRNG